MCRGLSFASLGARNEQPARNVCGREVSWFKQSRLQCIAGATSLRGRRCVFGPAAKKIAFYGSPRDNPSGAMRHLPLHRGGKGGRRRPHPSTPLLRKNSRARDDFIRHLLRKCHLPHRGRLYCACRGAATSSVFWRNRKRFHRNPPSPEPRLASLGAGEGYAAARKRFIHAAAAIPTPYCLLPTP